MDLMYEMYLDGKVPNRINKGRLCLPMQMDYINLLKL